MNDRFELGIIKDAGLLNNLLFACFNKGNESLAMYKMYADKNNDNGAMIGIPCSQVGKMILDKDGKSIQSLRLINQNNEPQGAVNVELYLGQVCYYDPEQKSIHAGTVKNQRIRNPFCKPELAALIKYDGWEYEKEIRLFAKTEVAVPEEYKLEFSITDDLYDKIIVRASPSFSYEKYQNKYDEIERLGVDIQESRYTHRIK